MGVGGFAFVTIVLFMVHELDEIVFTRRYIDKHSGDEQPAQEDLRTDDHGHELDGLELGAGEG